MRLIVTELLLSILRKAGVGGPYSADALFTDIKRKISRVLAAAILLAFVNLWISTAIYVMVAILIPIVGTITFFGKPVLSASFLHPRAERTGSRQPRDWPFMHASWPHKNASRALI